MAVPTGELLWLAAGIIVAGILTGVLAGLFGIGGGAVIVPVLFEVFRLFGVPEEVRMQLCIGTSLAIIIPTNLRSARAHRARGLVLRDVIGAWTVPAIVGVAVGSIAAAFGPAGVFKIAFAAIAGVIAAKLLLGRESWVISHELPGRALMSGYGFIVGLASSLMGISGGSVMAIILTSYGRPIHSVVATSAALGVPIAIAGTIGYCLAGLPHQDLLPPLSLGFVSAIGVVLLAPVSSYVAPIGARLAHALPRRALEIGFGLFLLTASARFVVSLLPPL